MSEQVTQWLREIDQAALDTFDVGARADAKRKAGSRRKAYERGLREVREVAARPRGRHSPTGSPRRSSAGRSSRRPARFASGAR